MTTPTIETITVDDLKKAQDAGDKIAIIDVREPHEADICAIEGSVLIPLSQFTTRFQEVPQDKTVIMQCHHGGRSMKAALYLKSQGWNDIKNLTGGIHEWALQIDPSMKTYE